MMLASASSIDAEDTGQASDSLPSFGQSDSSSTLFKKEIKSRTSRFQVRGTATDRKYTGTDEGTFGFEALFGHFFSPEVDQYSGYYLLSGKLESDNRQRFNATLAYFPPKIGGEAKMTYRLLHAEVRDNLPSTGEFDEGAIEQGLGIYYKKRFNILLKEFNFNYAYTQMGEESLVTGPFNFDSPDAWEQSNIVTGFGDIQTHNALVEFAAGNDGVDNHVIKGYRLDLGGGYQSVTYDEFYTIPEITDEGFSGFAELKVCTPLGILKGGYRDAQSANIAFGGYQLGGIELYYRHIDYPYASDEEIIGIAFTLDLFDIGSAFDRRCRPFFYSSDTGYTNVNQMGHINRLESDEFTAKKVNELKEGVYRVDKTQLQGNFRIDTDESGEPKLCAVTSCSQVNIQSVVPSYANNAVTIGGPDNREICMNLKYLGESLQTQQTVVVTANDNCCGDTQVMANVTPGSLYLDNAIVQEGVGCVKPEVPENIPPPNIPPPNVPPPTPACSKSLGETCSFTFECCPDFGVPLTCQDGGNNIKICSLPVVTP